VKGGDEACFVSLLELHPLFQFLSYLKTRVFFKPLSGRLLLLYGTGCLTGPLDYKVFDKFFIHECLIRPKYFFQKFNPSPAQRRKKTNCMSFTLKLPQKLNLDFTFKA
jgi:hypothetical protein